MTIIRQDESVIFSKNGDIGDHVRHFRIWERLDSTRRRNLILQNYSLLRYIILFWAVLGDESPCQLPVDSGTCSSTETNSTSGKEEQRYYYSYANFKCTEFPYSGCGGNPNNFKSLEECKRKCNKSRESGFKIKFFLLRRISKFHHYARL